MTLVYEELTRMIGNNRVCAFKILANIRYEYMYEYSSNENRVQSLTHPFDEAADAYDSRGLTVFNHMLWV